MKKQTIVLLLSIIMSLLFYCKKEENCDPPVHNFGTLEDSRDSIIYKYIEIGDQVWMAENLNYKSSNSKVYDDDINNAEIFGRLYHGDESCSVCPEGWHLPSKEEWTELIEYLGGSNSNIAFIKMTGGQEFWEWKYMKEYDFYCDGRNSSGFTALPGGKFKGDYTDNGRVYSYQKKGYEPHFWTSTKEDSKLFYYDMLSHIFTYTLFENEPIPQFDFFSVRCVRDSI